MIRTLTGSLTNQQNQYLVVNVHGIGYLVASNTNRYTYIIGDNITLHTHLAVRENALDLYGFLTERELKYFELLMTIPKIGPKSALQILSQADVDVLATAIAIEDADHLHKVSGIGKKTAANIVTHLAGKIEDDLPQNMNLNQSLGNLTASQTDAIDALIALGYDSKEAHAYVLKLDGTLEAKKLIQSVLRQDLIS